MFQVIGYIKTFTPSNNTTKHVLKRSKRAQVAERLIVSEHATVKAIAIINKGHSNGNEVHVIYNNGVIKVYNAITRKLVTVLIARVPQVERYQIKVTQTMRKKINSHVANGYNNIAF